MQSPSAGTTRQKRYYYINCLLEHHFYFTCWNIINLLEHYMYYFVFALNMSHLLMVHRFNDQVSLYVFCSSSCWDAMLTGGYWRPLASLLKSHAAAIAASLPPTARSSSAGWLPGSGRMRAVPPSQTSSLVPPATKIHRKFIGAIIDAAMP